MRLKEGTMNLKLNFKFVSFYVRDPILNIWISISLNFGDPPTCSLGPAINFRDFLIQHQMIKLFLISLGYMLYYQLKGIRGLRYSKIEFRRFSLEN